MNSKTRTPEDDLDDVWSDLIVAMLAVNRFSLEKSYSLKANLRNKGLLDPQRVNRLTHEEVALNLSQAGYDRGDFLNHLIAGRLVALGDFVAAHGIHECERVLASNKRDAIRTLLTEAKGIGPTVLANFFVLRS